MDDTHRGMTAVQINAYYEGMKEGVRLTAVSIGLTKTNGPEIDRIILAIDTEKTRKLESLWHLKGEPETML